MTTARAAMLWFGWAAAAGLAATPGLLVGGVPLLPLFLAVVGLACAAHRPNRSTADDDDGRGAAWRMAFA